ncbi:LysM peptidoglycan-binding domain-containing protein [Micromonospora sp. H33]|uniref:LysM peptidoglycan-binding domain-containing protein n=1 Tax=Micromonospora sp. H33 TaxID=3452215 RepID=UPI003F8A4AF6
MTTPARTVGRVLTGFGALVLLCGLLVGAPVALLALAGNPLPEQVPTLAEVGAVLTSRDDGQLFLRALALAGWAGWATFALSVLVELGALALRRPAPRLPGMSRQQRAAAALVGSVALILAASPAAASAAAVAAGPPTGIARVGPSPTAIQAGAPTAGRTAPADAARRAPVYRVATGDHLGSIAERYLDSFGEYRTLARLNRLADPDRIHPGQLLRLPAQAEDRGVRPHATGRLVARPTRQRPAAPVPERPAPERPAPERSAPATPDEPAAESPEDGPVMTVGAARPGDPDRVNRPLAVSAILAVSSIIGAQIGAVLGLRRRPAPARVGGSRGALASARYRDLPTGRHRRD